MALGAKFLTPGVVNPGTVKPNSSLNSLSARSIITRVVQVLDLHLLLY
jgi:hypothetical protein